MEYTNREELDATPCVTCGGAMYYVWCYPGTITIHRETDEYLCPEPPKIKKA